MEALGAYNLIIGACIVLMLSFAFGSLAKKTNIPSVLMLIALGVGIQYLLRYLGVANVNFFPVLEVLGIVGLIMIVLEAALELKLKMEKVGTILKALLIAILGLGGSVAAASAILFYLVPGMSVTQCIFYATPLSILSSAIIIPSVGNLVDHKKEFHIYESTFSDIIGIMLFYFLISYFEPVDPLAVAESAGPVREFALNTLLTLVVALLTSYLLLAVFQRITEQAKLFVLIAILLTIYAVAKKFHLSPLIIILVFGLAVSNSKLFFIGPLKRLLNTDKFKELEHGLHGLTIETAFVVRTFFFVIFGASIVLGSLINPEVVKVSLALIASIYIVRWLIIRILVRGEISPQIWIAPRGLITVLLFYAIPEIHQTELFDPGVLLFVIIASGLVMTMGLVSNSLQKEEEANVEGSREQLTESPQLPSPPTQEGIFRKPMRKLRMWYLVKIKFPIVTNPQYQAMKKRVRRYFRILVKSTGTEPIFSPEHESFFHRVHTVFKILRSPTPEGLRNNPEYRGLKTYLHRVIFGTDILEGMLFDVAVVVCIIISIVIVMLQSVSGIGGGWQGVFMLMEIAITVLFIIEYLLRVWTSPRPRLYMKSFYGVIDLLAILPMFIELLFASAHSLGVIRAIRLVRIFRILKLGRFIGQSELIMASLKASSRKIGVFLFFVLIVCSIIGALMFVIEGPENGFTSIPKSVYWAVVTLTTVGYGDITPSTPIGQIIAMTLMVMGYGIIAVPTGLVTADVITNLNQQQPEHKETEKCSVCEKPLKPKDKFCRECGQDVVRVDSTPSDQDVPPKGESPPTQNL